MLYKVINRRTLTFLGNSISLASTFTARLKGLLGTSSLPIGSGLLIRPCNSVHTLCMNYSIDVLFLNDKFQVIKGVSNLPPMKGAACWGAAMALELPAGTIERSGTKVGHHLAIEPLEQRYEAIG